MKDKNLLLSPPTVVTIISTAPGVVRAGVIQVIVVSLSTLKEVTFNPPNLTALAPVKTVPVIVTLFPPSVLPDDGEILVTTGGAT